MFDISKACTVPMKTGHTCIYYYLAPLLLSSQPDKTIANRISTLLGLSKQLNRLSWRYGVFGGDFEALGEATSMWYEDV